MHSRFQQTIVKAKCRCGKVGMSISFLSEANVFLEALWKKITGKTEVKEYKKMLLAAEKKLDIERSDENFEKSSREKY